MFETNAYRQIVVDGYQGQFCSVFCFAMALFLYRNRRCAKLFAKKDWTSPERFQGNTYPKYKYCSELCKKRWHKHEPDILTTAHVMEVLGAAVKAQPPRRTRASKKAKSLVWQNVAAQRDFCDSATL